MIDPIGFKVSIEPPWISMSTAPSWLNEVRMFSEMRIINPLNVSRLRCSAEQFESRHNYSALGMIQLPNQAPCAASLLIRECRSVIGWVTAG